MNTNMNAFTAVVLAADRGPDDPVARTVGVPCKSFVPVGGRPMVLRVLDALAEAREVGPRIVCGPSQSLLTQESELYALITSGEIKWIENQKTPSSSAYNVLDSLPNDTKVLVTTADHALLNAEMVDYFCSEALTAGCDVVVGLASHELVIGTYPETKRTAIRLSNGNFCSCNLFAFMTPRARGAAKFWRKAERNRKKPWRTINVVGWTVVLRYLLGRLSLSKGLEKLSMRMNLEVGAVVLPFPNAAIDVDTVGDWQLVEDIISSLAV